jgi:flagellar biosynthesis protein FlhB
MSQQPSRDQKTEKPTPRRIEKAHEKGNVVRSNDTGQALALGLFLGWAALGGQAFIASLQSHAATTLARAGRDHAQGVLLEEMMSSGVHGMLMLAPLLGLLLLSAVLAQYMVTGLHLRKPLIPFEGDKLNPVKGLKNFINVQKLFEAGKALARVAIYAALAWFVAIPAWKSVSWVSFGSPSQIFSAATRVSGKLLAYALAVGVVLAVIDYAFSRYRWYRQLYMTKQEIRDENKENEGDPYVKGRMRSRQKEMSRHRMMSAVGDADVVVTNPTHVAVALKYEQETMAAPVVLAKGKDHLALRIRKRAAELGIPLIEDPPLARALEKVCPVGSPIPEALYRAVAEVFAYVLGRRRGAYRPHTELETVQPGEVTR